MKNSKAGIIIHIFILGVYFFKIKINKLEDLFLKNGLDITRFLTSFLFLMYS